MDNSVPQKRCKACQNDFDATKDFFYRKTNGSLHAQCKTCYNNIDRERKKNPRPPKPPIPDGHKRCTGGCDQVHPATTEYFYANKTGTFGVGSYCKGCRCLKRKQNYQSNRAQEMACMKQYAHTHRAQVRGYKRKYKQSHPEETNSHTRNRRARTLSNGGTHTAQDIQFQFQRQKGKCYYCRKKIKWGKHHVDHVVPLARGGSNDISNLVIACPACNFSKNAKMPHEWPQGGRLL